ncbi:MAG: NAD dependent epimerase/dehydratase family protein [Cenarchaeum symbiont of Oopsacas minuta]|nr:NAD dependent epimerase/dehydratase family protein [Cenarchaeum symbiont of Oopsacas minuta]
MRVLITGASGFIGYKLASNFVDMGDEVVALCNKNVTPQGCIGVKVNLATKVPDIPKGRYDIVYHLAAATPLVKSFDGSRAINYDGTKNILKAINGRTESFVYVTGTGIYGKIDSMITANTPCNPHTKYSKVRLEAQRYAQRICDKNKNTFLVACMGDVYGSGGWLSSQIVPRIKKNRFKVPGNGEYVKSFVHIDDVITALTAIGKQSTGGVHILADSEPIKFSDFIRLICKLLGKDYSGNIPSVIAKIVMGREVVEMLTTSTVCDGSAMAKMIDVKYPSYKVGIPAAINEIIT